MEEERRGEERRNGGGEVVETWWMWSCRFVEAWQGGDVCPGLIGRGMREMIDRVLVRVRRLPPRHGATWRRRREKRERERGGPEGTPAGGRRTTKRLTPRA